MSANFENSAVATAFFFPPVDWKRAVFVLIPKKGNAKQCSNYHTIAFFSHSSTLAWRIPWKEEAGRLKSMGLHRVGHN